MAADIAVLGIKIDSSDSVRARQELDRLGRSGRTVERNLEKVASNIGRSIGLMTAGFVATASIAMKSAINLVDSTGKAAQAAGLSAKSFSELRHAAQMGGAGANEFSASILALSRNIGNAARGSGEAKTAFDSLGIEVRDANGHVRDADKVFSDVADRFSRMRDGAEKTALATRIFGEAGVRLIPTLNGGARGLKDAADEAARFGLVVSDEAATAAAEFNDNLSRLKMLATGSAQSLSNALLPSLNEVLERLQRINGSSFFGWLTTSGSQESNPGKSIANIDQKLSSLRNTLKGYENANPIAKWWSKEDVVLIEAQIAGLESQRKYLKELQQIEALRTGAGIMDERRFQPDPFVPESKSERQKTASASRQSAAERYLSILKLTQEATVDRTRLEQVLWDIQQGRLTGLTPAIESEVIAIAKAMDAAKQYAKDQADVKLVLDDLTESSRRQAEQTARTNAHLQAQADSYLDLADPMREFIRRLEEIDGLVEKGFLSADMAAPIKAALSEAEKPVNDFSEYAKNAAQSTQAAFSDFFFDPFKDGIDGLAKNFARVVQRMVADAAAAQLMKALMGDFAKTGEMGGWLGSLMSAGGGPVTPAAKGAVFPGLSAYSGSIVSKPTIFPFAKGVGLMGEAGAEAVLPLKRGRDGRLGVSGSGTNNTFNITIQGQTAPMSPFQLSRAVEDGALRAVQNHRARTHEF